ncbi:MAG: hypothetical protein V4736_10130 [Bdellovibrionota bacterium]
MKKYSLIFLAVISVPLTSLAWKGVSGGNGSGGTLLEVASYSESTRLSRQVVYDIVYEELRPNLKVMPFIDELTWDFLYSKAWYLEDRAFHPECLNSSVIDVNQEIWACQNDVEIRIRKSWWEAASNKEKAQLILHEVITAMRFHDQKFSTVGPAVYSLLTNAHQPKAVQDEFLRLRFPYMPTTAEIDFMDKVMQDQLKKLCAAPTKEAAYQLADLLAQETMFENNFEYPLQDLMLKTNQQAIKKFYGDAHCTTIYGMFGEIAYVMWKELSPYKEIGQQWF